MKKIIVFCVTLSVFALSAFAKDVQWLLEGKGPIPTYPVSDTSHIVRMPLCRLWGSTEGLPGLTNDDNVRFPFLIADFYQDRVDCETARKKWEKQKPYFRPACECRPELTKTQEKQIQDNFKKWRVDHGYDQPEKRIDK